jgi:hypothetical protein
MASVSLFSLIHFQAKSQHGLVQDDPVLAPNIVVSPVVDGNGNDLCWQNVPWQSIAQVWIPYGVKVDSSDYSGRYKVVWSSKTNLLYFLVEVTDDVFVDGFIPGVTSDIYNYDIIEVFIDEDKSGGLHVFDGKDSIGIKLGINAENAFAYHIYAPFPKENELTTKCFAGDIAGTNWSDIKRLDYGSHFPEFALRRTRNKAIWEFSLIVYNDAYNDTMASKGPAQLKLYEGKVMGLTLAYCDNDHPKNNPKERDKFFGSVYVPVAAYNDHWMNADYFGTVILIKNISVEDSNHH